jgi:K+-transporting ATPase ATPase C chain
MLQHFRPAFVLLTLFTLLLGLAYPLAITGVSQLAFSNAANGSPVLDNAGTLVGSSLIGQDFQSDKYFHGRPSATSTPYDAANSSGSNLGPLSQKLMDRIKGDIAAKGPVTTIPSDSVMTSASGLDPHVSPQTAVMQIARIAQARALPEAQIASLVEANTEGRVLGIIGEPRVNVLRLNMDLDKITAK